jgi:transposase
MVKYAQKHGIKPTAKAFHTTPKTVRKWVRRFEEEKKPGLRDRSKRPQQCPNQIKPYWYFKINDVCKKAKKHNKRITAIWIKRKHSVPYSTKTILKVMREIDFLPQKRKRYQRRRDLREVKQKLKAFEKIQVDIKYLDDIPEFYGAFTVYHLPKYQITARCVRTGALYYAYAMEKSVTNTTMFILRLAEHLKAHGIDLSGSVIQTDNGSEFITPWNSLENSSFTNAVEKVIGAEHRTIPPGAKTWQSDVETSHRLIEDEFYACEYFFTRLDFRKKAAAYQSWFNHQRDNSYKNGSPAALLRRLLPEISTEVLTFKPITVDTLYRSYKNTFRSFAA